MPFTREQKEEFKLIIKEVMMQIFSDEEYLSRLVKRVYDHSNIEKRLEEIEVKIAALDKTSEHVVIEKRLNGFEEKLAVLAKENIAFKTQLDTLEQYNRKSNIILNGINEEKDENIYQKVSSIIKEKLHINLSETDINICHRLGKMTQVERKRPVIVRFTNLQIKQKILENRKFLKGTSIFVGEDLTKMRYRLYTECRDKLGKKNVWTANGKIHVKVVDNDGMKKFVLEKCEDVSKISKHWH